MNADVAPGRGAGGDIANAPHTAATPRVLAVLDDVAAAAALLAPSAALARELGCELTVVYVESAASLLAAAYSTALVLPHAASAWLPLRPDDVEQGFRSHAARLRQLTERLAVAQTLRWSLRVMRGSLAEAPALLTGESTLLFMAAPSPPGPAKLPVSPASPAKARAARRPLIAVAGDGHPPPEALAAAQRLAQALGGVLMAWPAAGAPRPDVLVMARRVLAPAALARLPCPVLLVG